MYPIYIALAIALGMIVWQWNDLRKAKKQIRDFGCTHKSLADDYIEAQRALTLLKLEHKSLKEENELLRLASAEIYNCGYKEGSSDAFTSLSDSVIDCDGKLKVQLDKGKEK